MFNFFTKKIFAAAILSLVFFLLPELALAAASSDAIATRVIPNPNYLSPLRWYQANIKNQGSPQALIIDGYEAIRDGRTVYVNAANISGANFYTNIYLLSFNQDVEPATEDIFGQLLIHWKFNINILDSDQKQKIVKDTRRLADLAEIKLALDNYQKNHNGKYPTLSGGSYLANKSVSTWPSWQAELGAELGITMPLDPDNKLGDCSNTGYNSTTCWNQALKKFADPTPNNNEFNLPEGSHAYVYTVNSDGSSYNTCSVMDSGLLTPGNTPSACSGSNNSIVVNQQNINHLPIITCGVLSGYPHDEFIGYVKAYDADGDNLQWSLDTASLGTDWSSWTEGAPIYSNTSGNPAGTKQLWAKKAGEKGQYNLTIKVKDTAASWTTKDCSIVIKDGLPIITSMSDQTVHAGDNLNYLFKVVEATNQYPLSYIITPQGGGPALSCNLEPNKHDCRVNQKIEVGIGTYKYTVKVTDSGGDQAEAIMTLIVTNESPTLSKPGEETVSFTASTTNNFNYSLEAADAHFDYDLISQPILNLPSGWNQGFSKIGDLFKFTISGFLGTATKVSVSETFDFLIKIIDKYGALTQKILKINVINNPPNISLTPCGTVTRINQPYSCQPLVSDPENNKVFSFSFSNLPSGLSGNITTGLISGSPVNNGVFNNINITATDEYGATNSKSYSLKVNTYCGDGTLQATNGEGVAETCEDGNTNNNDACDSSCEWTCKAMAVDFKDGSGDGIVYDDDNSISQAENIVDGDYLKILGVIPTPYIWIANSSNNRVTKLRTYDGKKRDCARNIDGTVDCWWVDGTWETMGQLIGTYNVGVDPSRTAVNVETGDVWVANRGSGNVTKLDINGVILKTCATGSGPRGVAIEENGDVWVGNYTGGGVVKISGDDTSCNILKTVPAISSYGLAIDSKGNIWSVSLSWGAQKIDVNNGFSVTNYPTVDSQGRSGAYGITVDLDDNVWLGGYPNYGAIKINTVTGTISYFGEDYQGMGLTVDLNNDVWVGTYTNNGVLKISPGNHPAAQDFMFRRNSGGHDAHGAGGDSQGNIWVVNYTHGTARVFNSGGNILSSIYSINGTDTLRVFSAGSTHTYTYSDMTGLNRALLLRSGVWADIVDSGYNNQHWGNIDWQSIINSVKQSIELFIRASNDESFSGVNWLTASDWNSLSYDNNLRRGRYAQIKIIMRSNERGVTPVLSDLKYTCN